MVRVRTHVHAVLAMQLVLGASCCSNREPSMSSPATPPTILGAFTPLRGGYTQAIAPGDRVVTLLMGGAAWWDGDAPVTAALPPHVPVYGARLVPGAEALRVGLGTLDLATRTWSPLAALERWGRPGPDGAVPVRRVAWFADAAHVALIVEGAQGDELVVLAADGTVRGRRAAEGVTAMAASRDRVLLAAGGAVLVDMDARVVAEPSPIPDSIVRVGEGDGVFAAVGAAGDVALIGAADGAVLATWAVKAHDAVAFRGGVAAVTHDGTVRVGCLDRGGAGVRQVAEVPAGVPGAVIQLVGNRLVLAGAGSEPVKVAAFANPCGAAAGI